MKLPEIDILNRNTAGSLLRRNAGYHHVISISDPTDGPPRGFKEHPARKLALQFYDIPNPDTIDVYAPKRKHVEDILRFAKAIEPGDLVLCHCNAGISRSSATALMILASKLTPSGKNAQEAIRLVMSIKTDPIHPNHRMVRYADEILGYGGLLEAAYSGTFQGADWSLLSLLDGED